MSNKQQVLLIHGGTTHENYEAYLNSLKTKTLRLEWILSRRDWKNELQDQLGDSFLVYMPQMPNKQNAQYEEWKILFERIVALLDENFILVGHSLGALFLAKYLSEQSIAKKVKKTMLLGAPFDNEGMDSEPLFSFLRTGSLEQLVRQAGTIYLYHSEDDFAVPFAHLGKYQCALPNAYIRTFKDRNHFLQASVPELVADIKN
jgi:hypothetical protein